MPSLEAFGLNDSDLNPFLFACVGTEVNGSALTVLSVLARLGSDPWTEAGRLATLPRSAAIDWLAERIMATPLTLKDINGACATAERLVLLLPPRSTFGSVRANTSSGMTAVPMGWTRRWPGWAAFALVLGLIVIVVLFNVTGSVAPPSDRTDVHDR